jgi:hypothetical protein
MINVLLVEGVNVVAFALNATFFFAHLNAMLWAMGNNLCLSFYWQRVSHGDRCFELRAAIHDDACFAYVENNKL